MTKINTSLRNGYKTKDGLSVVRLFLYLDKKVVVNTGVSVKEDDWDDTRKKVKRSCKNYKAYNLLIQKSVATANDILIKWNLKGKSLNSIQFKREYNNYSNSNDFCSWMDDQIKERELSKAIVNNTAKNHRTACNRLREYTPNLTFTEINGNYRLIENWERWLEKKHKNGLGQRSKLLKNIKTYINIAVRDEILEKSPFEIVKIKRPKERIVYLDKSEIKKLEKLYQKKSLKPYLQTTLRNWLFSFYCCGIRRGDFKALQVENIHNNRLIFDIEKLRRSERQQILPLSKQAKALIKESAKFKVSGTIFNCLSDQKENEYIKDICKDLEIDKKVTFHVARHTFATLFWEGTKDLATLQKLLGHGKITTTMVYTHVSEKLKTDQGNRFYDSMK